MAIPVALGVAAAAAAKGGGAAAAGAGGAGFWGALAGAGSSIFGGLLGSNTQEKLTKLQIDLQREFAQHGIQWRVEDAKRAGIHPAAALGAFPTSYSPIIMEDPLGKSVADAGQDISGAINKMQTEDDRLSTRLSQELLRSQINENDMRSAVMLNDIQRKNTEGSVPGFPSLQREGIPGQAPAPTGDSSTDGYFSVKPPEKSTGRIGDPSGEPGSDRSWQHIEFPGFGMRLPTSKGESWAETWSEMPNYEKWGWIMYNAQVQGSNWLRDFVNFGLTGRPGKGENQEPFMDNKPLTGGAFDAIGRAINKYVQPRRYGKEFESMRKSFNERRR